jgi:hypothetical protein
MPIVLNGTDGITQADQFNSDSTFGFKNRIINGAMVIDQRNAGASVTPASGDYTLDRWRAFSSAASKYSVQQNAGSVTPPAGFTNYLGVTSLAATSVGAGDYYFIAQYIEGFNSADLNWGTANAKTITVSFWVRSSLTGTFGGSILNATNSRSYPFSFTINSANTWEYETITIAGDTSGTWVGATNGVGLYLELSLGMGSTYSGTAGSWSGNQYWSTTGATSVVGTNGATFYITGVQLEVGSTATSFDYRPYGTEFSLCERYFQKYSGNSVGGSADGGFVAAPIFSALESYTGLTFPQMRTGPSLSYSSLNDFTFYSDATSRTPLTNFVTNGSSNNRMEIYLTWSSNLTAGFSAWVRINKASGFYSLSAEL